jgi:hypothetical protein
MRLRKRGFVVDTQAVATLLPVLQARGKSALTSYDFRSRCGGWRPLPPAVAMASTGRATNSAANGEYMREHYGIYRPGIRRVDAVNCETRQQLGGA